LLLSSPLFEQAAPKFVYKWNPPISSNNLIRALGYFIMADLRVSISLIEFINHQKRYIFLLGVPISGSSASLVTFSSSSVTNNEVEKVKNFNSNLDYLLCQN